MIKDRTIRNAAILVAVLLCLSVGKTSAQTDADVAAVTEANSAFYAALSALDAAAMEKVWAQEAYVADIGPRSKAVQIGPAAVHDGFKNFLSGVSQVTTKPGDTQVHINGNVAWTIGQAMSEVTLKNGTSNSSTTFVTSVFEKKDEHWLMVSHHSQRVPQ